MVTEWLEQLLGNLQRQPSISDPGSNPALDDLQINVQLIKSSLVHNHM